MAFKHIRAAQKRAIQDPLAKSILVAVAADIGTNGEAAYPSYRTLAERTGIHYNTIGGKMEVLSSQKLIKIEKRGKRQYYTLLFDCADSAEPMTDYDNEQQLSQPECDNSLSQRLSQIEQRLSQIEGSLSQSPRDLSSIEAEEAGREADAPPPPAPKLPPAKQAKQPERATHFDNLAAQWRGNSTPEPVAELMLSLRKATNSMAYAQLEKAAYTLNDNGITAEQVGTLYTGAGCWWYTADWRGVKGDKPNVSNILETALTAVQDNELRLTGDAAKALEYLVSYQETKRADGWVNGAGNLARAAGQHLGGVAAVMVASKAELVKAVKAVQV